MSIHCVVCVKQVPDTKRITTEAMKEDGTVNRAALPAVFNPEDLNALEAALAVRDACGGKVTVVTMGLPKACDVLRESLFRGADDAVLITDRRAAASDTLATSYILSCAMRKLDPDLVFCGRQAIDGDTAQVGPQLAEKLGFNLLTYMEEFMGVSDNKLKARRNIGAGWEVVSCRLPALVTVMDTANTPRPRAAKRIMKFKKAMSCAEIAKNISDTMGDAPKDQQEAKIKTLCDELSQKGLLIKQWNLDDVEADLAWCGMSGSPTKVNRIQSVVLTGSGYHEFPATQEGISKLIGELIQEHTIG